LFAGALESLILRVRLCSKQSACGAPDILSQAILSDSILLQANSGHFGRKTLEFSDQLTAKQAFIFGEINGDEGRGLKTGSEISRKGNTP
jgi:hypothetical protein